MRHGMRRSGYHNSRSPNMRSVSNTTTPSVIRTARRTILNRKREEKNMVAAIITKKRTSKRMFSG
jgi:hypothetical protein